MYLKDCFLIFLEVISFYQAYLDLFAAIMAADSLPK